MLVLVAIFAVVAVAVVELAQIAALAVKAVIALIVGIAALAIVTINTRVAVGNIVGRVDLMHLALHMLRTLRNRSPSPSIVPTPIDITYLNHLLY